MKCLIIPAALLSTQVLASATCSKFTPGRARSTAASFTILVDKKHAHLSVKECDMTLPFAPCEYVTDAIYQMEFRPTRLQIWDLQKVSGFGPENLVWEEKTVSQYTPPCLRCNDEHDGQLRTYKNGLLTEGQLTLCEARLQ